MPDPPLRAVALIRMSSARQEGSPGRQKALFVDWCARHNVTPVGEYEDLGVSATKVPIENRAGIMSMLADASHDRFDIVWVEEESRAFRDPEESIRSRRYLRAQGVQFCDRNTDPHSEAFTRERELLSNVRADLAWYEAGLISDRIRRTLKHRVATGQSPGSWCASGLAWDRQNKAFVVDEETAPLVRRAFALYAETGKLLTVAEQLNREGFRGKRGGLLTATAVRVIVGNPIYRGEKRWGGERYPAAVPEVVPPETLARVDELLARAEGRPQRATHATALFAGLLKCPTCGGWLTAHHNGQRAATYHCTRAYYPDGGATCTNRKWLLEKRLEKVLVPVLAGGLRRLVSSLQPVSTGPEGDIPRRRASLEQSRARARRLFVDGAITREELDQEFARLDRAAVDLTTEKARRQAKITALELKDAARGLEQEWSTWKRKHQRKLLLSLVEYIVPDYGTLGESRVVWRVGE